MENNVKPAFLKDSTFIFIAQIVSFVTGIGSGIITARILGPAGKGALRLLVLLPSMIVLISSLGIEISNVYFIGKKKYGLRRISSNSIFIAVCVTIFFGLLYFLFQPKILTWLHLEVEKKIFFIAFALVPFSLMVGYGSSILLGLRRVRGQAIMNIIRSVLLLLSMMIFVWLWKLGVNGGVYANLLAVILAYVVVVWFLRNVVSFKPAFNARIIKDSITFGLKGHIGNVAQTFNYRLDFFLVGYFLNPTQVGFYSVAVVLAELIWYIPRAFSTVLFPKVASSSKEEVRKFTPLILRFTTIIIIITALGMILIGKPAIEIMFGERFSPAFIPMVVLLIGIIPLGMSKLLSSDIAGRGFPEYNTYASLCALGVTVILDILLIPRLGIAGAAIASSVSYFTAASIIVSIYLKKSGNSLSAIIIKWGDLVGLRSLWKKIRYAK